MAKDHTGAVVQAPVTRTEFDEVKQLLGDLADFAMGIHSEGVTLEMPAPGMPAICRIQIWAAERRRDELKRNTERNLVEQVQAMGYTVTKN